MDITRRSFLAGLGVSAGAATLAGHGFGLRAEGPGWQVGYSNAPAAGFAPSEMKLISGAAPEGLSGSLYRNGPAWFRYRDEVLGHWFDGDGMVQRIAFQGGKAIHSGRFVQTHKHKSEQAAEAFLAPGFGSAGDPSFAVTSSDDVNAANTSVLMIDGELHALWEAGSAIAMDSQTLETRGPLSVGSDLKGMPFLAHPKVEPGGRIWNLAVAGNRVGIYKLAPSGALEAFQLVQTDKAAYIHDWAMTERHLVLMLQPWVQTRSLPPFVGTLEWRPDEGLDLIILDKDDLTRQRRVTVDGHAFYHTGAAWEDAGGAIHIDVCLYEQPFLGTGGATNLMRGEYDAAEDAGHNELSRIVVEASGAGRIEKTGIDGEFPAVHPGFHGLQRRMTVLVGGNVAGRPGASRLTTFDWRLGAATHFDYGANRIAEEHLVVPKPGGRSEYDAWIVGTALNTARQRSEVHVFEAVDVSAGPIASFAADYAWPLGFHGTFAAG
ncbi:MAG: carotenoid oxygenase family protein [Pseudomonadota bacterium]